MPQRGKSASGAQRFCWTCVVFLSTVLVLHGCVLFSLLQRLTLLQRLGPDSNHDLAESTTVTTRATVELPSNLERLAVVSALGTARDELLLFMTTFQDVAGAHVLLLINDTMDEDLSFKSGMTLHRVRQTETWMEELSVRDARLYHSFAVLQSIGSDLMDSIKIIQVAAVEDIAFQADPFLWASAQTPGVHLFTDQDLVGNTKMWKPLSICFVHYADFLRSKPAVAANYMIGTKAGVQRYLSAVVDKIQTARSCKVHGVAEVAVNVVAQTEGTDVFIHNSLNGPVWTGDHIAPDAIPLDSENHVINQNGYQYAVLRGVHQHTELLKRLQSRLAKGKTAESTESAESAESACSNFQVEDGDMQGHDLKHGKAESELQCCSNCQANPSCSAFIFSPARKHCWLKAAGGIRTHRPGSDMRCGLRISAPAA